jgi:hypothetical protein
VIALTLVSSWSPRWGLVAYVLWWINTAMAIVTCIGIPYVFVKYEPPGVSARDATSPDLCADRCSRQCDNMYLW